MYEENVEPVQTAKNEGCPQFSLFVLAQCCGITKSDLSFHWPHDMTLFRLGGLCHVAS